MNVPHIKAVRNVTVPLEEPDDSTVSDPKPTSSLEGDDAGFAKEENNIINKIRTTTKMTIIKGEIEETYGSCVYTTFVVGTSANSEDDGEEEEELSFIDSIVPIVP
tara:strand:+ start:218 stop:535 length:318 start_codon:yes stop_codon:yes gene_type:complete